MATASYKEDILEEAQATHLEAPLGLDPAIQRQQAEEDLDRQLSALAAAAKYWRAILVCT